MTFHFTKPAGTYIFIPKRKEGLASVPDKVLATVPENWASLLTTVTSTPNPQTRPKKKERRTHPSVFKKSMKKHWLRQFPAQNHRRVQCHCVYRFLLGNWKKQQLFFLFIICGREKTSSFSLLHFSPLFFIVISVFEWRKREQPTRLLYPSLQLFYTVSIIYAIVVIVHHVRPASRYHRLNILR